MSLEQSVLDYLRSIAPQYASNQQIAANLGITVKGSVYQVTRRLLSHGLLRGERRKRAWVFAVPKPQVEPFEPVGNFSAEHDRSGRSWQARWLVPLLSRPEGREWLLRRLGCPSAEEEGAASEAFHFCLPLRDLFTADYLTCRGCRAWEDQFVAYYNRVFGLPSDFGRDDVWRVTPNGDLLHPAAPGRGGWSGKYLKTRVPSTRLRRQAHRVRRILRSGADLLLVTAHYVFLVDCRVQRKFTTRRYKRLRMLGGALERRLGKTFYCGLVVTRSEQAGEIELPCVLWDEISTQAREYML